MRKREELTNPDSCISRANPDEMTFVLLARDVCAPAVIGFWVQERIRLGKNQWSDPQITEALSCARAMEESHLGGGLCPHGEYRQAFCKDCEVSQ